PILAARGALRGSGPPLPRVPFKRVREPRRTRSWLPRRAADAPQAAPGQSVLDDADRCAATPRATARRGPRARRKPTREGDGRRARARRWSRQSDIAPARGPDLGGGGGGVASGVGVARPVPARTA